MRRILALLLLTTTLAGVHAETGPDVRIAELLPDPGEGREFIELLNAGDVSQDLAGWRIEDAAGNAFTFTDQHLGPGQRIVVWGGGDATPAGPAWSKATVWNNGGDTATLSDDLGQTVDTLTYGAGGEPAPPTGQSLTWQDGWIHAEPTPGTGPGASGTVTAHVQDLPPDVTLTAPASVDPEATFQISFEIEDPNGDAVTWTLFVDGATVLQGSENGTHQHEVQAPASGETVLRIEASDGTHASNETWTVQVAAPVLQVGLPAAGIQFPDLAPGAQDVQADAPFWINNTGTAPATPRMDLSDFTGPGRIQVAGNVSIRVDDGPWQPYLGPLTQLPEIPAGGSAAVWLRIDQVPLPLAAGDYGTSFTVVP